MCDTAHSEDKLVLLLSGDIDVASTDDIVDRGTKLLQDRRPGQRLVLDLARVEFIDSSGLSAMLRLRRLAHEHGTTLALQATPKDVESLLRLTGLQGVLPTESS